MYCNYIDTVDFDKAVDVLMKQPFLVRAMLSPCWISMNNTVPDFIDYLRNHFSEFPCNHSVQASKQFLDGFLFHDPNKQWVIPVVSPIQQHLSPPPAQSSVKHWTAQGKPIAPGIPSPLPTDVKTAITHPDLHGWICCIRCKIKFFMMLCLEQFRSQKLHQMLEYAVQTNKSHPSQLAAFIDYLGPSTISHLKSIDTYTSRYLLTTELVIRNVERRNFSPDIVQSVISSYQYRNNGAVLSALSFSYLKALFMLTFQNDLSKYQIQFPGWLELWTSLVLHESLDSIDPQALADDCNPSEEYAISRWIQTMLTEARQFRRALTWVVNPTLDSHSNWVEEFPLLDDLLMVRLTHYPEAITEYKNIITENASRVEQIDWEPVSLDQLVESLKKTHRFQTLDEIEEFMELWGNLEFQLFRLPSSVSLSEWKKTHGTLVTSIPGLVVWSTIHEEQVYLMFPDPHFKAMCAFNAASYSRKSPFPKKMFLNCIQQKIPFSYQRQLWEFVEYEGWRSFTLLLFDYLRRTVFRQPDILILPHDEHLWDSLRSHIARSKNGGLRHISIPPSSYSSAIYPDQEYSVVDSAMGEGEDTEGEPVTVVYKHIHIALKLASESGFSEWHQPTNVIFWLVLSCFKPLTSAWYTNASDVPCSVPWKKKDCEQWFDILRGMQLLSQVDPSILSQKFRCYSSPPKLELISKALNAWDSRSSALPWSLAVEHMIMIANVILGDDEFLPSSKKWVQKWLTGVISSCNPLGNPLGDPFGNPVCPRNSHEWMDTLLSSLVAQEQNYIPHVGDGTYPSANDYPWVGYGQPIREPVCVYPWQNWYKKHMDRCCFQSFHENFNILLSYTLTYEQDFGGLLVSQLKDHEYDSVGEHYSILRQMYMPPCQQLPWSQSGSQSQRMCSHPQSSNLLLEIDQYGSGFDKI